MNERIREFEKQCWSHYINGTLIDGHLHFDAQKFAELIVGECMSNLYLHGYDDARQQIKKHFEVESCTN